MKLLVTKEGKASFAVGIVLVLSGLLMTNPVNEDSMIVSIIIGITALIKGGFEFYLRHIFFKHYGNHLKQLVAMGIFLLLSPLFSDALIKWLVAVCLIVAGFVQIVAAFCEPKSGR